MLCEIKNEKYTAQVDTLGAQLMSLKGENGFEYIWVGDKNYWGGRAPVLFPIVGALRNGRAEINGEWIEMGQHGFARGMEFAVTDNSGEKISLTLASNGETRKMYPFGFELTVTYTLCDNGIKTEFTVKNTGDDTLPFAIGGHPGFNIPVNEAAAFEDYTIKFEKPETQTCPTVSGSLINPNGVQFTLQNESEIPLKHSLFYKDALIFDKLNSETVQIVNKTTGHGVEMNFSGFPMLGIWSAVNDGPYVCLEPWTGCATLTTEGDKFTEKKGMTFLPMGTSASFSFNVKIL